MELISTGLETILKITDKDVNESWVVDFKTELTNYSIDVATTRRDIVFLWMIKTKTFNAKWYSLNIETIICDNLYCDNVSGWWVEARVYLWVTWDLLLKWLEVGKYIRVWWTLVCDYFKHWITKSFDILMK